MEASQSDDRAGRSYTRGRRGWRMARAAWRLTRRDRTVLLLALMAGVAGVAALGAAFVLVTGHFALHHAVSPKLTAAALLACYPLTFLVVFLHVAIAAAANAHLEGDRLPLGQALKVAHRRTASVAFWAIAALAVSLLSRLVTALLPDGLDLVVWPLDLLWVLVTIFVVPLIACDEADLREALQDSRALLHRGWGEALTGLLAIGLFNLLLVLPAFALLLAGLATLVLASNGGFILIAIGLAGILIVTSLFRAIQQVFAVALYRYAASEDHIEVAAA